MRLLFNCQIYDQPLSHTAMAIENGRITAIGTDAEVRRLENPAVESIDLGGRYVIPGITDSHIHLDLYGQSLQMVDCAVPEIGECLERVHHHALALPAGEWIIGHGWNQNFWLRGHGSAAQLDAVSGQHPVFLTDKSLHSAWVNTAALQLAGIVPGCPDPSGGTIQRDAKGIPTGILFEKAMNLVEIIIPPPSFAQRVQNLLAAQQKLLAYGVTAVHDFDRIPCFAALQQMDEEGVLGLRVLKSIPVEQLPQATQIGLRGGFGNDHLRIGSVKMFADGALGPQTAALRQPYEGNPKNFGSLLLSAEEILETGMEAAQSSLSLAVHAIGDRATHEVLTGLSRLREHEKVKGLPALRHRIEHMQLIDPSDLHQAARLKICLSMQPVHLYMDMQTADRNWGNRSRFAYAIASLLRAGSMIVFGSDAPVETPNPFWGIHAAVTRKIQTAAPGSPGWYPEESISMPEAIQLYTATPARQAGMQGRAGRIAPGYMADLVILDANPLKTPPDYLHTIKPERVMVDGKWVIGV